MAPPVNSLLCGGLAERPKAAGSKPARSQQTSGVRIPCPPRHALRGAAWPPSTNQADSPQGLSGYKGSAVSDSRLDQLVSAVAESVDAVARFRRADELIGQLNAATQALQGVKASAVTELHTSGRTYRQIGSELGLSTQRVGQLVNTSESVPHLLRAWNELERKLALLGSYREVPTDRRSSERLVGALLELGDLTDDQAEQLNRVRTARNDAVHARRTVSDDEIQVLLDEVISLSAQLELGIEHARSGYENAASEERNRAEALLRRVVTQYPDIDWYEGRCDECGRAIPVSDVRNLWVCSAKCRSHWMNKLYQIIDRGSQEEVMSLTPHVVPYWL